jgi:hypothetical protein
MVIRKGNIVPSWGLELGKIAVEKYNLIPRACDPWEGTRGSGIICCRKPGILAKIELRILFQRANQIPP